MNQILATNNSGGSKRNNPINIKKIVLFFCVIIILFGVAIASTNIYKIYKKRSQDPIIEKLNKPEVLVEQLDDGNIKIIARYDQGIDKISYIWNDTDRTNFSAEGKTYIEKLIEMPEETSNELEVSVTGKDGQEEKVTKKFEKKGDTKKPIIDWVVSNNLLIIATDETELAYLTYKWNEEEEVMIEPDENDKTRIEERIEIIRGTNNLTITAVDTSGNVETKSRTFQGINEPEISWKRYGNIVDITVIHDMGFEKIIFLINGEEYTYDKNSSEYDKTKTEVKYQAKITEGENLIIVKAYSNEGSEKIKEGRATYNP